MSFDEDLKIMKVNKAAEKILEMKAEAVIGKHHTEILSKPIAYPVRPLRLNRPLVRRSKGGSR